jgi:adenylate cyclase class IV
VAAEFEVQQQIRQTEIEDLRQRLKDLDTSVHDKQEQKDAIIRKRTEDLLERTPGLMW